MGLIRDYLWRQLRIKSGDSLLPTSFSDPVFEQIGLSTNISRLTYTQASALQAYHAHELVFACINKIADVLNDTELIVEARKDAQAEWKRVDGHPCTVLLKRPNTSQTGRDIRRLMVQSEQATGRFYLQITRSKLGIPVMWRVLNPLRIAPKYRYDTLELEYYEYTLPNGRIVQLSPDEVLFRKRPDLIDQGGGFAPLAAALKSINSDIAFTDYVDAFFESDGVPSGILKVSDINLSDERKAALQAQWRRSFSRNGTNQKGTAVLDQKLDYQRIGSNLDELASDSLSGRFESRICSVFGVPPNLVGAHVGLQHVTANATAKAELQNFWENKISGELSALREWLTWFVLPLFEGPDPVIEERVRIGYDISHVAFLQEDVEKIHERARKNFLAGGWTLNEFRTATGVKPDPDGEYYLQPRSIEVLTPEARSLAAENSEDEQMDADVADVEEPTENDSNEASEKAEKKKDDELAASKSFDLDGLVLGREPQGVEAVIDLKRIVGDQVRHQNALLNVLKRFRKDLIAQAAAMLDSLDASTAYTLTLIPDPKVQNSIKKTLTAAYRDGRLQITGELNAQKASSSALDAKASDTDWLEYIDEITDGLVSKMISEISARAVNVFLRLKLLVDYSVEKLEAALLEESEKFIELSAGNTVNAAVSRGRDDEIKEQLESGNAGEVLYSAILDANTCGPCEDADGETATDPQDLPAAPNPECEGGDRCRCIHVAVRV